MVHESGDQVHHIYICTHFIEYNKLKYTDKLKNIVWEDCPIIGKEKFLNSAVLVPIIIIDGTEHILFEKRSKKVRQPGEISFPGGHFDPENDKDFLSTAVRETTEELGLSKKQISVFGKLGTLIAPMGVLIETFIGSLNITDIELVDFDKSEVEEIFTIPVDYFVENKPEQYFAKLEIHPYIIDEKGIKQDLFPVKELGLPDKYSNPWTNGKHRILVYKTQKAIIWGMTAEIIFELSKKLRS